MPAPSRRTGLSAAFIGLALAVILIAGFALGPRAFEFSAWPQPSNGGAVEEVVARPSDEVTEVPVARVRRDERERSRSRSRGRDESVSARGRNARGDRIAARGVTLDARSGSRGGNAGARRGGRGRDGGSGGSSETAPPAEVVVDETPAPAPEAPAEQPAQLAEVAPAEPVLRPDAEEFGSVREPEPQLEADGLVDEVDRLIDSLLPDESRHGHRGRRHGHR